MEPKKAKNIIYCDCCHDLVQKGEVYFAAAGKLFCSVCWGTLK